MTRQETGDDDGLALGGGAAEEVLRETAQREVDNIPTGSAGDPSTFVTAVLDYLQDRRAKTNGLLGFSGVAVFVSPPYPQREASARDFERVPGFQFAWNRNIGGAIHVVGANLGEVFELPSQCSANDGAFAAMLRLRLHEWPAVIADADGSQAIICPGGTQNESGSLKVRLQDAPMTSAAVDGLLTDFYENWLITPNESAPVWHHPGRRVPAENAEKAVQRLLFPFARATFRKTHDVRKEDDTMAGRADITLMPRADRPSPESCVLELKVLRERHFHSDSHQAAACPPTVNEQAVVDGINQGMMYQRQLHNTMTYLCCYDFRAADDDTILSKYASDAASKGITCRRYYLYASAPEYRTAQPGALTRSRGSATTRGNRPSKPSQ